MAAFDFPSSPNNGDTYSANGIDWIYNGSVWKKDATAGVKGQKGEVGQKGQKGEVGEKGTKGEVGDKGQKGEIGATGGSGGIGDKGQKGEVGATGAAASKGQKGEIGATGGTGGTGDKGQKGATGSGGSNGSDGSDGDKGQKGEEGESGMDSTSKSSGYTLVAADDQRLIVTNSNISVPTGVFSAGDAITIYNNSGGNITINQGGTMYLVGTSTTGNRVLAQRGLATIVCVASNTFVISGGGLS